MAKKKPEALEEQQKQQASRDDYIQTIREAEEDADQQPAVVVESYQVWFG